MSTGNESVLGAIRLAMEAERKAAVFYREGAREATNPLVHRLFEQLAEWENIHYAKLLELEKSVAGSGAYAAYAGSDVPLDAPSETGNSDPGRITSAMRALSMALQSEVEAEKRYTSLAAQISDATGKATFERFAAEEHKHYLALRQARWDLGNLARPA